MKAVLGVYDGKNFCTKSVI